MERETFDRFTRLMGTAGTRRDALRLVATGALLGGITTIERAAAKGRKQRGKVRSDAESPPCIGDNVPSICLVTGGTGCGQPDGNCATKRIGPGANLTNCSFTNESGNIFQTNFASANLTGTCWLAETLFNHPNFRGANLTNACFFETDLSFSDFRGTNLSGATFCLANLTGVDFRGSNLTAEQLAHAGQFGCGTILPNGTPAVQCAKGQTCVERAVCTCQQDSDCTRTGVNCDHPGCLNGFCSCVPI
jgi:hypothetical protein